MQMQSGLIAQRPAWWRAGASPGAQAGRARKEVPLVDEVGRRLGLRHPDAAVPVVLAVLQPLLGSLSLGAAAQLEVTLPAPVRRGLRHDDPIRGASFQPSDRFLAELAERNGIDTATAATWTRAVCAALANQLPSGVLARIRAQVPGLVRAFFPEGERLAPPLPERAHRCQETQPMWSEIERPVPSYLMFLPGDPITGRPTEGVALADGDRSTPVFPEEAHVPTHGPVLLGGQAPR